MDLCALSSFFVESVWSVKSKRSWLSSVESSRHNSYSWPSWFDLNLVSIVLLEMSAAVDEDVDVSCFCSTLVFTLSVTPFNISDVSK